MGREAVFSTFDSDSGSIWSYGASHLTTTTCVQNALLDERNISYWPIFLKLKIEGEKFSHNPQIGGLPYMVYV